MPKEKPPGKSLSGKTVDFRTGSCRLMGMANNEARTYPVLDGAEVINTGIPCSMCAQQGRKTVGGGPRTLRHVAGDDRLFCNTHGYIATGA